MSYHKTVYKFTFYYKYLCGFVFFPNNHFIPLTHTYTFLPIKPRFTPLKPLSALFLHLLSFLSSPSHLTETNPQFSLNFVSMLYFFKLLIHFIYLFCSFLFDSLHNPVYFYGLIHCNTLPNTILAIHLYQMFLYISLMHLLRCFSFPNASFNP